MSQRKRGKDAAPPEIVMLRRDRLFPNPNQPRSSVDDEEIKSLAASFKSRGILNPLQVTPEGMIIAGERRWRASEIADLDEVPAIVKDATPEEAAEIALIENDQRVDLNEIDRAMAYRRYLDTHDCTHDELAKRLGIKPSTLSERLGLLNIPPQAQEYVCTGKLTFSHARSLFGLSREEAEQLSREVVERGLTVRETEEEAKSKKGKTPDDPAALTKKKLSQARRLADNLRDVLLALAERDDGNAYREAIEHLDRAKAVINNLMEVK